MWYTMLIGLLIIIIIISIILPIIAITKVSEQNRKIQELSQYIRHLHQQVNQLQTTQVNDSEKSSQNTQATFHSQTTQQPTKQINTKPVAPSTDYQTHTNKQPRLTVPLPKQSTPIPVQHHQNLSVPKPTLQETDESSANVVTSLFHSIKNWFMGENLIVRVGALLLLVGVVLLLKLASQYVHVSIAIRMALVALAGFVMTGIGYKVGQTRRNYGLTLQGVGFATIYLTIFASFRLYQLLPSSLALLSLIILTGLTVMFSVWQNALPLAILTFGGAFFAPILISSNSGNIVMLFSYYLLLNIAVAIIAHYRTWKLLNALSLTTTFGLAYLWGFRQYVIWSENGYISWLPIRWQLVGLLTAHMALYLFIAIRYSQQVIAFNINLAKSHTTTQSNKQVPLLSIDAGLLFGTALLGFGLQASLLHDLSYHLAFSSAILSAIYLGVGFWLLHQFRQQTTEFSNPQQRFHNSYQLLIEATLALGIGFLMLVLPLALSAKWTSVGWVVQGACLVWLGMRSQRLWTIWAGLILQGLSLLLIFYQPTLEKQVLPLFIATLAVAMSAFLLRFGSITTSNPQKIHQQKTINLQGLPYILAIITAILSTVSIFTLVDTTIHYYHNMTGKFIFLLIWLFIVQIIDKHYHWLAIRYVSRFMLPIVLLLSPWAWFELFDSWYFKDELTIELWQKLIGLLLTTAIIKSTGVWLFSQWHQQKSNLRFDQAIWIIASIIATTIILTSIPTSHETEILLSILPTVVELTTLIILQLLFFSQHSSASLPKYLAWFQPIQLLKDVSIVLFPLTWIWLLMSNYELSGQFAGYYLPIVNPLDLLLIAIILYEVYLIKNLSKSTNHIPLAMLLIASFWTISNILVRTFANYLGTPLWEQGAWFSPEVQTGLTILWSIGATVLMFLANRQNLRMVWFAGVTLLAIVVIKLIFVDMSKTSAMLRVISFIGAGGLMLIIGYLAPLPPSRQDNDLQKQLHSH